MPSYIKSICSKCGKTSGCKDSLCSQCLEICPECGSRKSKQSKTCKGCYTQRQAANPELFARLHKKTAREKARKSAIAFFESTGQSRNKTCRECEVSFLARNSKKETCPKCSKKLAGARRQNRLSAICLVCQSEFSYARCRTVAKYCSKACWNSRNPPKQKKCEVCSASFESRDLNQKTCSKKCSYQWRSENLVGEKAPAWKDGKSLQRERLRLGREVKIWKAQVHQKDSYTCQHCGQYGGSLHAHHIKPWADYPDLRFDLSNGITLCIKCHGKVHGKDFAIRTKKDAKSRVKKTAN